MAVAAMEPAAPLNELVSAEGRNRKAVLCQRCGSRVLQPGTALFSRRQVGGPGRGRAGRRRRPASPRPRRPGRARVCAAGRPAGP